ncbi:sulfotransferase family protein [Anthocerotibacter panamensis]|uniref:sulfotransferase family protein n=1 Tax=Anthocerotibacter panamensis TaxID=2857077 RepID=UPI001C40347D|nr:sulfotransferase [Anthocerotibacter panamensis]
MNVPQPVFILASPRSFTSLICAMLGQHPETYGVPELNLFVAETMDQLLRRFKGLRQFMLHGLLRTVAQLYGGEQTMLSIDMAHRWIGRYRTATTAEVYQELCRKVAPLRIVDKSPVYCSNPQILLRLQRTFPEAHYLYLVRHPRTQGQSVMKVKGGAVVAALADSVDYSTQPPTIDPQYAWYKMQRIILDFLGTVPPEKQLRVRGEDVLNDPAAQFELICRWLGLTWSEDAFEQILQPENSTYACPGPYGAHLGNDPNFLKSPGYRYRGIDPSDLAGPLPWRKDGTGFTPEVIRLCRELGYP